MTKPEDCPNCDAPFAYRNGYCGHCGHEEPAEQRGLSPWPDDAEKLTGAQMARKIRSDLRESRGVPPTESENEQ